MKILIDDFMQNSDAPAELISPALADDYAFSSLNIDFGSVKAIDGIGIGYTDATEIQLDEGGQDYNYTAGDQENLNNPDGGNGGNTSTNFMPFRYRVMGVYDFINQTWLIGEDTGNPTLPPCWGTRATDIQGYNSVYDITTGGEVQDGIFYFQPLYDSLFNEENDSPDYTNMITINGSDAALTFAPSENNGLKRFYFKTGEGYIEYYYDKDAWETAIGTGNCKFLITRSGAVYKDTISDANLIVTSTGKVGAAGGGSALPSGKVYADISFIENGLYTFSEVSLQTFRLIHNGSYIGRVAIGKYREIKTTRDKEPGLYTTEQIRETLSLQVVPGAGGASGRSLSVDTRYAIDSDTMADFYAAYDNQLAKGYPLFIWLDCESFKLPFDRLYGQLDKPEIVFQNSINRFRYSKRFNFKERF